ncbi:MAG: hypothetical protein ACTHK7_08890 [Aureliella sp.]
MSDLYAFTQAFGPVVGLILYIVSKQLMELAGRNSNDSVAASLARIEEAMQRVEGRLNPPTHPPIDEGHNGADQPTA